MSEWRGVVSLSDFWSYCYSYLHWRTVGNTVHCISFVISSINKVEEETLKKLYAVATAQPTWLLYSAPYRTHEDALLQLQTGKVKTNKQKKRYWLIFFCINVQSHRLECHPKPGNNNHQSWILVHSVIRSDTSQSKSSQLYLYLYSPKSQIPVSQTPFQSLKWMTGYVLGL